MHHIVNPSAANVRNICCGRTQPASIAMDNRPLYALRQAFLSSSAATFWRIPDTHPPILQIPLFAQYLSCFCKPSLLPQSPTIIATPSTLWLYLTLTAHLVPYHQCHSKYTLVISQVHFSSSSFQSINPVRHSSPSIQFVIPVHQSNPFLQVHKSVHTALSFSHASSHREHTASEAFGNTLHRLNSVYI